MKDSENMTAASEPTVQEREFREHRLKTWPEYFQAVIDGEKLFEIQENDRNFRIGDALTLEEWDPDTEEYTGRNTTVAVTYITDFGTMDGFVVMGILPVPPGWPNAPTPPSVSAREIAERIVAPIIDEINMWAGEMAQGEVRDAYHKLAKFVSVAAIYAIASAITPFEEQIREKDREIERLKASVKDAEETSNAGWQENHDCEQLLFAAEARLDRAVKALKGLVHGLPELLESIGYADEEGLIEDAKATLSEIETKEAAE